MLGRIAQQRQGGAIDRGVGLADLQHGAAQLAIDIGQGAGAENALARHHHRAVRIDAEHGQPRFMAADEVGAIGLDRAGAAIRVGAGVEQELRVTRLGHQLGHALIDH
jgi:hypothetical protein